jgi:hypothetical protein
MDNITVLRHIPELNGLEQAGLSHNRQAAATASQPLTGKNLPQLGVSRTRSHIERAERSGESKQFRWSGPGIAGLTKTGCRSAACRHMQIGTMTRKMSLSSGQHPIRDAVGERPLKTIILGLE